MTLYRKPVLGATVTAYKVLGEGKPAPTHRRASERGEAKEIRRQSESAAKIFERLMRSSADLARLTGKDTGRG